MKAITTKTLFLIFYQYNQQLNFETRNSYLGSKCREHREEGHNEKQQGLFASLDKGKP